MAWKVVCSLKSHLQFQDSKFVKKFKVETEKLLQKQQLKFLLKHAPYSTKPFALQNHSLWLSKNIFFLPKSDLRGLTAINENQ
jgi:hypothetical protein